MNKKELKECLECGHDKMEHPVRGVSGNLICKAYHYYSSIKNEEKEK